MATGETWESRELAARAREDAIQTQWDEYGRDDFRRALTEWLDRDDLAISDDLVDNLYDQLVARSGIEPEVSDAVTFVYDAATLDYCLDRDAVVAAATKAATATATGATRTVNGETRPVYRLPAPPPCSGGYATGDVVRLPDGSAAYYCDADDGPAALCRALVALDAGDNAHARRVAPQSTAGLTASHTHLTIVPHAIVGWVAGRP